MLAVDLVVFDLMGTVVKDTGAMEMALRATLSQHGVPFADADLASMRGAGKQAAFRTQIERTLGGDPDSVASLAGEMYVTFKRVLRQGYEVGPTVEIPGAGDVMRWLRSHGVKVAATSALDSDLSEPLLEKLGWSEGVFDCKVSTSEVPQGRPAPYMIFLAMMRAGVVDVRRVAAVGDTRLDLKAGTNAGCGWVVGVLSGAGSPDVLGAAPHTNILDSVAELPRLFEG
jgi:phosphonatase-like hydrolase